jgi:ribose 5-phosphate isomerase A
MTISVNADVAYLAKYNAAQKALEYIDNNMSVGLGTGSTANIFIDLLAEKVKQENLTIQCVATSEVSSLRALEKGLVLLPDSSCHTLDIAVDGADEFDNEYRLIKGGGGALLREKIIAQAAQRFVVIADNTKYVACLGAFALPVECVNYESGMIFKKLSKIFDAYAHSSADDFIPVFRKNKHNSSIFLTDLRHTIVDMNFKKITDPEGLAYNLQNISGIVEHGLFLNEADTILTNDYVLDKKG